MDASQKESSHLPIKCNLTRAYVASMLIAILMTVASVAGLLYQSVAYPTDELLQSFVPNDVVNLFIGLPILLGSMLLTQREKLIGLLFWPGALFYVFYTYFVYIFSMPFNAAFLLHLTLFMLSAYTMIDLIVCIDGKAVKQQLTGAFSERISGGVLAGLGMLFFLRVILVLITALINQTTFNMTELALHVTDFMIAPAWVIGGLLLWKHKALGYVIGLGLLFQASMLFIGLIFVMILQSFITSAQFLLIDVLVVFLMGTICFIPFVLFMRAVVMRSSELSE